MRPIRPALPVILAALMVLAGCSSTDEATTTRTQDGGPSKSVSTQVELPQLDDEEAKYVESMVASVGNAESTLTEDQARCWATLTVDMLGMDRLNDKGVQAESVMGTGSSDLSALQLSAEEANGIYDNFARCGTDMAKAMRENLAGDPALPPSARECVDRVLSDENVREFIVASMTLGPDRSEDPRISEFLGDVMACSMPADTLPTDTLATDTLPADTLPTESGD